MMVMPIPALKLLAEAAEEAGQDVLAGNGAAADQQLATHPPLDAVEGLARLPREGEHPRGVGQEQPARSGGARRAAETVEQTNAQLVLERADVLRHRRLRQMERLGGAREGSQLGDPGEDLELPEVHGRREYSGGPALSRAATPPPP
jgi:hypothetical protein